MHPLIFLVPALGLIFGPRLWVRHVLNKHNRTDENVTTTAGEFARLLLDRNGLQVVRVESTDIGDHYDPEARAVRIARDKIDRKTLTALTTVSHEVGHAIQHASDYAPFVWRNRSVKIAQFTGDVGAVLLLSIPATTMLGRSPLPPALIGTAALAMLGTSLAAQLAALPSELDASFARAMPMLRESGIDGARYEDAHEILLACSLTYVASSMVAILHIWPWIGRPVVRPRPVVIRSRPMALTAPGRGQVHGNWSAAPNLTRNRRRIDDAPARHRTADAPLRRCAKAIIRGWLELASAAGCEPS